MSERRGKSCKEMEQKMRPFLAAGDERVTVVIMWTSAVFAIIIFLINVISEAAQLLLHILVQLCTLQVFFCKKKVKKST